jgi:nitrogen fixation/metabolism regulation signal transduction histidine kinase
MLRQVVQLVTLAIVVATGVGVGIAIGIVRPVRKLRDVLELMTRGDLDKRIDTTRKDELGELGRGFDRMADQLQHTLTDVREDEARFRGLIGAAFDGFAIHEGGRILEASSAFASLFGYAQGELIGHPVLDLVAPAYRELMTAFFLVTGWGPAIDSAEARGQGRRGRPGQTVSTC